MKKRLGKLTKIHTKVEKEVLKVYQEENPSTLFIEKKKFFDKNQKIRETLFRDRLKFPLEMFKDKEILEFGSGTGDNSLFYAKWGANLTCVEMNKKALERLKYLFSRFNLNNKIHKIDNCSLFDFKPKEGFYDMVISDGVLHHTNNAELGFRKLVCNLKPKGFVMVSLMSSAGGFQRNLMRLCLLKLSKNNKKEIIRLAKRLFTDHIKRAVKFGRRTPKAVIYDSFINPKTDHFSASEVLRWFDENNITFYSSYPALQFPFPLIDSANHKLINLEKKEYRDIISFSELYWMNANKYDEEVIARNRANLLSIGNLNKWTNIIKDVIPKSDFDYIITNLIKKLNSKPITSLCSILDISIKETNIFISEVLNFIQCLDENQSINHIKKQIKNYKTLFKGYCGLGETFYIGYKRRR